MREEIECQDGFLLTMSRALQRSCAGDTVAHYILQSSSGVDVQNLLREGCVSGFRVL